MDEYLSQTDLGKLFTVSSHVIGKWLIECGLRTSERKPSREAFEGGFVRQAPSGRNGGYFYVWHKSKTLKAFQSAGHRPKGHSKPEDRHQGPFKAIKISENGYQIADTHGTVGIWVLGKDNADQVTALLNSSFGSGMFFSA